MTRRRALTAILASALAGAAMLLAVEGFRSGTASAVVFQYGTPLVQSNGAPTVVRDRNVDVVTVSVKLSQSAAVTVRGQSGKGQPLTLLAGSHAGSVTLHSDSQVLQAPLGAGTQQVTLRLTAAQARAKQFTIVVSAAADGRTGSVSIPAKG
jgi:hypothetical protein